MNACAHRTNAQCAQQCAHRIRICMNWALIFGFVGMCEWVALKPMIRSYGDAIVRPDWNDFCRWTVVKSGEFGIGILIVGEIEMIRFGGV